MNRGETIRTAFERFSRRDFDGVLEFCQPDVEMVDPLHPGLIIRGTEAIRHHWTSRFERATAIATIGGHIVETCDGVIVVARYQIYDESEHAVGPPVVASHRFTFREDLIVRWEAKMGNSVPADVKTLLRNDGGSSGNDSRMGAGQTNLVPPTTAFWSGPPGRADGTRRARSAPD